MEVMPGELIYWGYYFFSPGGVSPQISCYTQYVLKGTGYKVQPS